MSSQLDKSLDEIIKEDSKGRRNSRGGASRNRNQRGRGGRSPYSRGPSKVNPIMPSGGYNPMMMQNQAMMMQAMASAIGKPTGGQKGKILISNLDYKVTESDLRELFQQIGTVRKATLNFDHRGRSKGNGEVVFSKESEAYRALEKYNGVTLDGRPMKIEVVVMPNAGMQVPVPVPVPMIMPAHTGMRLNTRGRGGRGGRRGGGARDGGARGGKRGNNDHKKPLSREDLDAEMDDYMLIDEVKPDPAPTTSTQ
ncbi:hypothetical protein BB560_006451 [Smittium megazygosporum]|uniref:RRM domain-containing protein n=1 Tax=Smittium megazygosporum TaxID=133381 RepID=A0A2T9Y5S3_9FUNG|nr:hypothetical protein BB560_006451 [Smittium megazygosporum]